jgi:hypothetical protein
MHKLTVPSEEREWWRESKEVTSYKAEML